MKIIIITQNFKYVASSKTIDRSATVNHDHF